MFGWFKKDPAKHRKVILQDHYRNLHVTNAVLTDSGWVAKDPWGDTHLLTMERCDSGTGLSTIGNSRIEQWFFHTGWEAEKFLMEADK